MFYLKQYNKTLLQFDIEEDNLDGQRIVNITDVSESYNYLLPIGVEPNSESLMKWLKSRIIPKNRAYVDSFLAKMGLSHNDIKGIFRSVKDFH